MIYRAAVSFATLRQAVIRLEARHYTATRHVLSTKQGPSRPTVKEDDLEEAFLKGSGPGGQKIVSITLPVALEA